MFLFMTTFSNSIALDLELIQSSSEKKNQHNKKKQDKFTFGLTIYCLPFISPAIHIVKYYQTVQSCSSATDENLTRTALDILRDLGILSVSRTNIPHSTQTKRKSCLP